MNQSFDRRLFLQGLVAAGVVPQIGCGEQESLEYWLSAQGGEEGEFGVALLGSDAETASIVASPFRGHDLAQNPARPEQVVMFGRRPGREALVLDVRSLQAVASFGPSSGRSMMGHGFFSTDGTRLYATEADNVTGAGTLTVRSADDWRVLDVIPTEGIGPHQTILMPDGETAVVANGGILTRPETGREKLNLDTMRSTLTYITLSEGQVIASEVVSEPKASIRHLEAAADGSVAIGLQLQRDAMSHNDVSPLVGVHRLGEEIALFDDGLDMMGAMNDYVGSVAVCSKTRVGGFTSPRGNLVAFWNIDNGRSLGSHNLNDVSGITVSTDERTFVLSSSTGIVRHLDTTTLDEWTDRRRSLDGVRFDNHLITVGLS